MKGAPKREDPRVCCCCDEEEEDCRGSGLYEPRGPGLSSSVEEYIEEDIAVVHELVALSK
jgi:hypothetical protein